MSASVLNQILVTRTDRLGDVLMTMPSLRYLRNTFPTLPIDFLVNSELHAVLAPPLKDWNVEVVSFPSDSYAASRKYLTSRAYSAALILYAPSALQWAARGII